jgi:hypothetical protein
MHRQANQVTVVILLLETVKPNFPLHIVVILEYRFLPRKRFAINGNRGIHKAAGLVVNSGMINISGMINTYKTLRARLGRTCT